MYYIAQTWKLVIVFHHFIIVLDSKESPPFLKSLIWTEKNYILDRTILQDLQINRWLTCDTKDKKLKSGKIKKEKWKKWKRANRWNLERDATDPWLVGSGLCPFGPTSITTQDQPSSSEPCLQVSKVLTCQKNPDSSLCNMTELEGQFSSLIAIFNNNNEKNGAQISETGNFFHPP